MAKDINFAKLEGRENYAQWELNIPGVLTNKRLGCMCERSAEHEKGGGQVESSGWLVVPRG